MDIDKELSAIRRVGNIVKELTPFQRSRVLRFVMQASDDDDMQDNTGKPEPTNGHVVKEP